MSILIDMLIHESAGHEAGIKKEDGGICWVKAKPLEIFSIKNRLKDCWRILIGKSRAYHYYEDELKDRRKK